MLLKGKKGALARPHAYAWEKEYRTGRGKWRGTTNFELQLPPGSRVLEVGCGNGKHLSSLFNKGFQVHGIDVSPTAIKLAKEKAEFHHAAVDLRVADATELPYENGYFDAVFLFHVLGHLSQAEREKAALEAYRVLKKGGIGYFRDFHVSDLRFGQGVQVEERTFRKGNNVWVHYFTEMEAAELLEGVGFRMKTMSLDSYKHVFRGTAHRRCEIGAEFRK